MDAPAQHRPQAARRVGPRVSGALTAGRTAAPGRGGDPTRAILADAKAPSRAAAGPAGGSRTRGSFSPSTAPASPTHTVPPTPSPLEPPGPSLRCPSLYPHRHGGGDGGPSLHTHCALTQGDEGTGRPLCGRGGQRAPTIQSNGASTESSARQTRGQDAFAHMSSQARVPGATQPGSRLGGRVEKKPLRGVHGDP